MEDKERQIAMIEALSNAYGVSGFEQEVTALAERWIDHQEYETVSDAMGNLIIRQKKVRKGPAVLLDAHSDEVGFMVQAIRPDGTMTFLPLGGWSAATLSAQKVRVRTRRNEYIPGIIAARPVHFMNEQQRHQLPRIEDMVIDVGSCSRYQTMEELEVGIGAPVVPDVRCEVDRKRDLFFGKAMDCRIGVAALLETLRRCRNNTTTSISACLSSQEEVGERGIRTAMNQLQGEVAIVFEGCPADDTFNPEWMAQTCLGKGPMLRHMDRSMIAHPGWMQAALQLAAQRGIPVQEAVRSGGGNNGAVIQQCGSGIATLVIGIPVRYIHSHHGVCSYADYEAAVQLACTLIETLPTLDLHG